MSVKCDNNEFKLVGRISITALCTFEITFSLKAETVCWVTSSPRENFEFQVPTLSPMTQARLKKTKLTSGGWTSGLEFVFQSASKEAERPPMEVEVLRPRWRQF